MSSRPRVEDLVTERLNRKWGRPVHPVPSPGETSEMHRMLIEQVGHDPHTSWNNFLSRCQSHPHEAAHLDRRGGSCLHAACAKNPPVSVVRAILQACRRNGEVVLERDKSGRTPLMIAISSNADLEVIETLLKSSQRAASVNDHLGHLPLHLASSSYAKDQNALISLLLKVFPEAAGRESNNGRTPLQCAIENRAPISVVQLLAKACPVAVAKDGNGLNPLFLAIRRNSPVEIIRCLVDAYPPSTVTRDRGDGLPLRRAIENQSPMEVLECLCTSKLTVLDADRHIRNTALHCCIECGTAREETVRLLTTMAPEVALSRSRCGQTPLSLACQRFMGIRGHIRGQMDVDQLWNIVVILTRAAYYGTIPDDTEDALDTPALHAAVALSLPFDIITTCLNSYPEQASIRDKNGCYPLWLAILSAPSSHNREIISRILDLFPAAAHTRNPNGRTALALAAEENVDVDILLRLWHAYPEAGKQLDAFHRLFPFQVAALTKKAKFSDPTLQFPDPATMSQQDLNQVSAVFELLLAEPSVLCTSFSCHTLE